mgnify:CR=1 FL=1
METRSSKELARTAQMKRKDHIQLKQGRKRARTDGTERTARDEPTPISNLDLKNTVTLNLVKPKCMCQHCQGPKGICKNIHNEARRTESNIQLLQLKESSVINSTMICNQMMKAIQSKELARTARMKRKEQNALKRSRKGTIINKNEIRKDGISSASKIWNFGGPTCMCPHCHALMWHGEKIQSTRSKQPSFSRQRKNQPSFGLCCKQGKVALPPLKEPPHFLSSLLARDGGTSENYQQNIRSYNSMFAFTSMGGAVDRKINKGRGPYVFRLNGQNYHHIGTLLPKSSNKPRFQQLYIYDTENEIKNRIEASRSGTRNASLDEKTIAGLLTMLDENNTLAQTFRMARERFKEDDYHNYTLRLLDNRDQDGRQNNMPSTSEVAMLIVKDPTEKSYGRDIVLEYKDMRPKRISETHPKFMAMQYPLLFPYGEDGYRLGIKYSGKDGVRYDKKRVTMREYYAYRLQQRQDQSMLPLACGNLSMQFMVDAYTCIEQCRLSWIRQNQGILRTELYGGLQDALRTGDTRTEKLGRRIVLPASFTGGPRNKEQNYQDAMAICRWAGHPDLFVTFTCNPKWPEIQCMLDKVGYQKPSERPDILVRVFMIKLKELMSDIKRNQHFGKTKASK